MTTFHDGPAKGQHLLLRFSPPKLQVVRDRVTGKWDALDARGDTPKPNEEVFNYRLVKHEGTVHICCSPRSKSGFYSIAHYALDEPDKPVQIQGVLV